MTRPQEISDSTEYSEIEGHFISNSLKSLEEKNKWTLAQPYRRNWGYTCMSAAPVL